MRQVTAGLVEFLSLLPSASDPWGTGADLAEAASDGKARLPDSGSVVPGRGAGQVACCELLILLVSTRALWAVGICRIQS